jgi:chaperone modulatory protein CbpM
VILTMQQAAAEIGVADTDLLLWIEQRWVLPAQQDETFVFDEADIARARLIHELRLDLMVNEEAIPVVLSLLDQIHALRRALARLNAAIDRASPSARDEITELLDKAD